MESVQMIVPLGQVPKGMQVRKVTGSIWYTVRDELIVDKKPVVVAGAGVRFLIDKNGDAWGEPTTRDVVIELKPQAAMDLLHKLYFTEED